MEYYQRRVELGVDSAEARIYKYAAYCAQSIANGNGDEEEDDLDEMEEELDESEDLSLEETEDPGIDYNQLAIDYLERYLEFEPNDDAALLRIATNYLYTMADCANGVKYFQRLLEVQPDNCDAKRSLGYAYFGGLCTKNYGRAINYLKEAYQCISAAGSSCDDVDLILWIAQAYHLRAVDLANTDSAQSKSDYRNANEWYQKVIQCNPNHADAKKGIDQTSFEF
jgi:tetratricopeptide (TPR) repeat protein